MVRSKLKLLKRCILPSCLAMLGASQANAAVSGLGTFTFTGGGTTATGTSASGTYTTPTGATGKFTITQNSTNGYSTPVTYTGGANGLEISNPYDTTVHNDNFQYTLSLTPDDASVVNTVKIAQTSYTNTTSTNSEVARQTLSYTPQSSTAATSSASVANNPSVPMFYNAMGDYFMGQYVKYASTSGGYYYHQFTSYIPQSTPQLRFDSKTELYFYQLPALFDQSDSTTSPLKTGVANQTVYVQSNGSSTTSVASGFDNTANHTGGLPADMTLTNLIKSTSTNPNNQNTYTALSNGTAIPSGSTYVSYGVSNADSQYLINIVNPKTVTLNYTAIMNGSSNSSSGSQSGVYGETVREWITFGIESTPPSMTLTKTDGTTIASNGSTTTYKLNVTNTGTSNLYNVVLKDPAATGMTKQSGISCDTTVTNNACTASTLPTVSALEGAGYTIPGPIAPGQSYVIQVPVTVTATTGTITNTATASQSSISTAQTSSDTDTISYVFSGTVFNDSSVNGVFDSGEAGIPGATITLTNCSGTTLGTATTDSAGQYSFSFAATDPKMTGVTKVCIAETNATGYTADTTLNKIQLAVSGAKAYTNNNFGDTVNTGLLQLTKYQQVVPCNTTDLTALDSGFTTNKLGTAGDVPSGSCIAYRIDAVNQGNVDLTNVIINDPLMNDATRISEIYPTPTPKLCISGTTTCSTNTVSSSKDTNGTTTVKTTGFTIPGTGTATNKKASLYFNTLYKLK